MVQLGLLREYFRPVLHSDAFDPYVGWHGGETL